MRNISAGHMAVSRSRFRSKAGSMPRTIALLILMASVLLLTAEKGCNDAGVSVPAPNQDQAPSITMVNFVVGGQGDVDKPKVSSSATVNVSENTKLMLSGIAENPGGVKSFSLKFTCWPGGTVCQTAATSATPDASNKVPNILRILGSDGKGGAGNQAITYTLNGQAQGILVDASSVNFNGMTNTIKVLYQVTPAPPTIVSFGANPNGGYINVGSAATLSWTIACAHHCSYRLQGHDGLNNLVLDMPKIYTIQTVSVKPGWDTKYTLTAANDVASVSKDLWVKLYNGGQPSGSVFYFKMTCQAQGCVTPCFTIAVVAPDSKTANAIAVNQYGGYTPTQIDAGQFATACQ